jgi:hypothetical protein
VGLFHVLDLHLTLKMDFSDGFRESDDGFKLTNSNGDASALL